MLNRTIDGGSTRLAVSSAVLPNSRGRCSLLVRGSTGPTVLVAPVMKPTASWEGQEDICAKPALTTREREIARLLVARQTNAEIARTLGISLHTVRHHIEHVAAENSGFRRGGRWPPPVASPTSASATSALDPGQLGRDRRYPTGPRMHGALGGHVTNERVK
jgi:hypothetical protein